MDKIFHTNFETKIGKIFIASSDKGLCKISLMKGGDSEEHFFSWLKKYYPDNKLIDDEEKNIDTIKQLKDYLDGKLKDFTLILDMKGTTFQIKVWECLREIPYGEIRTYKDIAEKIKNPDASRAVGGANRANPFPVVIPCHRVIGTKGKLTGYAGKEVANICLKEALLRLEGYTGKLLY
jgi:O-6-methylguanine DNA methyltransferase